MISRIEAQSTAAASANSNQDEKIREMLDKIELNVWRVFNSTTGYFWNPGVSVLDGRYVAQVYIQIKLPTATRIHTFGLKARSDSERIKSWSLQAKMLMA